jgi:hypothetical protein
VGQAVHGEERGERRGAERAEEVALVHGRRARGGAAAGRVQGAAAAAIRQPRP